MAETLGLVLIDAGYFNIERTAMALFPGILRDRLKRNGWDLNLQICKDEKESMRYK
jgi:hypothetical protein